MTNGTKPILLMKNICIGYNGIQVITNIDFDLYPGEIHAIVGQRASGKSTFINVLSGESKKQSGTIYIMDREVNVLTPKSRLKYGIEIVSQTSDIIPSLNAVDFIYAGRIPRAFVFPWHQKEFENKCVALFKDLDLDIDLKTPVKNLNMGERHFIEIARALSTDPRIVIFDEVSLKLNAEELRKLFAYLRKLAGRGKGIIYVTSNIDEIFEIADRVTVLKNGYRRETTEVKNIDRYKLLRIAYTFSVKDAAEEQNRLDHLRRYNDEILNNLTIGIILLDSSHRIYLVNQTARSILEKENKILKGSDITSVLKGRIDEYDDIIRKIGGYEKQAYNDLSLDGSKHVKLKIFPVQDENQNNLGTTIVIESMQTSDYLNEYVEQAKKYQTIARLAAGVAHEIKNPLEIIKNYAELLKYKNLDEDGHTKLGKIGKELLRIEEIVDSLLSFSGKKTSGEERIDVIRLMEELKVLLNHDLAKKKVNLSLSDGKERPAIMANENKLKQLFLNLIINSIEAVTDNGAIRIEVAVNHGDKNVAVHIEDNGYGIQPEIQEEIFTPFFTTKMSKKNAGLGLSICQSIAEAHKGTITFSSVPGKGTRFTVTLPLG